MKVIFIAVLFFVVGLGQAQAGLIINNTRVIYSEEDGESVVQLKNINTGNNPILVQIWMDNGDPNADINKLTVPFNIMPAISRIDAKKGQAVRILRTKDIPANDRETLFWINFLDVPQKPTVQLSNGENLLQLSIRSRLKFFYRPKSISKNPSDMYGLVKLKAVANGSSYRILIKNPTPYYITFGSLDIQSKDNKTVYASMSKKDDLMLEPFSEKTITLKATSQPNYSSGITVHYGLVNDFGTEVSFNQP